MRISTEGTGGIQPAYLPAASRLSAGYQRRVQGAGNSFDQLRISQGATQGSQFQRELTARMVSEVRASSDSGRIRQLRDQVRSGTYQISAPAIAAAMLLES